MKEKLEDTVKFEEELLKARAGIEKAEEHLLDVYFNKIKEDYKTLGGYRKQKLLEKVKSLAEDSNVIVGLDIFASFDMHKAKIVRKKQGLNQVQLADRIGISRSSIQNYEVGRFPDLGSVKRYTEWLMEHGY